MVALVRRIKIVMEDAIGGRDVERLTRGGCIGIRVRGDRGIRIHVNRHGRGARTSVGVPSGGRVRKGIGPIAIGAAATVRYCWW